MDFKKKILDSLTDSQKYGILLLGANNFEPIRGKTWYQKELFVLSQNIDKLKEKTDFEADFIGPFSEIADEELKQLELYDIIEIEGHKLKLTDFGEEVFRSVERDISNNEKEMVSDFKSLLNDITEEELLGFIYYTYPDMTKESIKFDKIKPKRKKIAFSLYRKGKISLGKASEVAGIPIENLIEGLKGKGMEVYSY